MGQRPLKGLQEVFTEVVTHLRRQGERSAVGDGVETRCKYRGPNGLKCAVGCLIRDSEYRESIEGHGPVVDAVAGALMRSGVDIDNKTLSLLTELQITHDGLEPEDWEDEFDRLATRFELTLP